MASVRLENLVKRFGSVVAVAGIALEIADGEFVVLVGPSGCGKSTTLRLIAGLEPITEGSVYFDTEVVNDFEPRERDIAMVFQSYALYPHLNVRDNIGFSLKLQKMSREEIDQRVAAAAELLNITPLLDRKPRAPSGGQRQRVAMGRAIVRAPKVFLFDEPLSNLDANLRAQMRVEIKRLHAQLRTTVIYVTHDQIEAMTLADRIIVMNDGHIAQAGSPMTVYNHPVNRFVAGFIGAPKMNFIPARLLDDDGAMVVEIAAGVTLPVPENRQDAYKPYVGQTVELGLRPEHLTVDGSSGDNPATINAAAEVIEPMGSESLVFTTINGAEIAAKCNPDLSVAPNDQIVLAADMAKMHLIIEDGTVVPVS